MATILHVDMDAFFASVEQFHHPEWRGKPVIVGADPHERGVVSTCSYEARRYGVHSAMPSRTAWEHCPNAIFVRPHMDLYQSVSARVFEIFSHYSPYVEAVSIDEAFLDVTGSLHRFADVRALADALRAEVHDTCGITCSVGVANNRLLAKIGSEQRKPNGLTVMPSEPQAIADFLAPQKLGILWGVGQKTAELLRPYGLMTCGDIQRIDAQRLAVLLGEGAALQLHDYAFGRADDRVYWESAEEKSISREYTFGTDESDRAKVRATLLNLVAEVGRDFRTVRRWACTARIKLRDAAFNTHTRQKPFEHPTRDDISFRKAALELFESERIGLVRLVGFGVTNIRDAPDDATPTLFEDGEKTEREKRERLCETLDRLTAAYGTKSSDGDTSTRRAASPAMLRR